MEKIKACYFSPTGGTKKAAEMVEVYGNREYEDTLVELYDIAVESGFYPAAAVAAVAQHSIAERIGDTTEFLLSSRKQATPVQDAEPVRVSVLWARKKFFRKPETHLLRYLLSFSYFF